MSAASLDRNENVGLQILSAQSATLAQFPFSRAIQFSRRRMLRRIARVQSAADQQFAARWNGVVSNTERAFRRQDATMEIAMSAQLVSYRAAYASALGMLHRVSPRVEHGEIAAGRAALYALSMLIDPGASDHSKKVVSVTPDASGLTADATEVTNLESPCTSQIPQHTIERKGYFPTRLT